MTWYISTLRGHPLLIKHGNGKSTIYIYIYKWFGIKIQIYKVQLMHFIPFLHIYCSKLSVATDGTVSQMNESEKHVHIFWIHCFIPIFPMKIPIFPMKIFIFPMKISIFPMKIQIFPMKISIFPMKISIFPMKISIFWVLRQIFPTDFLTDPKVGHIGSSPKVRQHGQHVNLSKLFKGEMNSPRYIKIHQRSSCSYQVNLCFASFMAVLLVRLSVSLEDHSTTRKWLIVLVKKKPWELHPIGWYGS